VEELAQCWRYKEIRHTAVKKSVRIDLDFCAVKTLVEVPMGPVSDMHKHRSKLHEHLLLSQCSSEHSNLITGSEAAPVA
jgi:hypothetical protein